MLRPPARVNLITDTLVEGANDIRLRRDEFSGPVPQFIGRVYDSDAPRCPLPAILFQVPSEDADAAGATGAGYRHESWLHVWANVVTANPENRDGDLHELACDLKKWMLVTAGGLLVNRVRMTGEVLYDGWKSHIQIADVAGRAALRQFYRIWYKWDHDAG